MHDLKNFESLFDKSRVYESNYYLIAAFIMVALISVFVWKKRKKRMITRYKKSQPLAFGVLMLIISGWTFYWSEYGRRMRINIRNNFAVTTGRITERKQLYKPIHWTYKYQYFVGNKEFCCSNVQNGILGRTLPDVIVDSQLYYVVYDSLNPANSMLDITKPFK